MQQSTISAEEVEKFSAIADEWWDLHGKFAPLHRINTVRIEYIKEQIIKHQLANAGDKPLTGLKLLDIGSGGGLISEPMARLGAEVTGVDASSKNISVAKHHAEQSGLEIDYRCTTAEDLVAKFNMGTRSESGDEPVLSASGQRAASCESQETLTEANQKFDVVLALEIVEHVADVELFVRSVTKLVKPGGLLIMSTINRTAKAYALAIIGAEYVLRWLPRGTHEWSKFVTPSELKALIEEAGGQIVHSTGMVMNPLTFKWSITERDLSVNYLLTATKG